MYKKKEVKYILIIDKSVYQHINHDIPYSRFKWEPSIRKNMIQWSSFDDMISDFDYLYSQFQTFSNSLDSENVTESRRTLITKYLLAIHTVMKDICEIIKQVENGTYQIPTFSLSGTSQIPTNQTPIIIPVSDDDYIPDFN